MDYVKVGQGRVITLSCQAENLYGIIIGHKKGEEKSDCLSWSRDPICFRDDRIFLYLFRKQKI